MTGNKAAIDEAIRRGLESMSRPDDAIIFPTLLINRPPALGKRRWTVLGRADDIAASYFSGHGFCADRVRRNLHGYPGLLRNLASPPPWVRVEPEELDGQLDVARIDELRPLIARANEMPVEALVSTFTSARREMRTATEKLLHAKARPDAEESDSESVRAFRELIGLAKAIGSRKFDQVYDAVFDLELGDEFSAAAGAPDLLVWLPDSASPLWFFAEVKAPGDYLSTAQKRWLKDHWEIAQRHFLLIILE